jgi:hypothetical protein
LIPRSPFNEELTSILSSEVGKIPVPTETDLHGSEYKEMPNGDHQGEN